MMRTKTYNTMLGNSVSDSKYPSFKGRLAKIALLFCLLMTGIGVRAADYVIFSNGNYYNGTAAGTTTFNPNTCIWTGNSGGTFTNKSGTSLSFEYQYYKRNTVNPTSANNTKWTVNENNIYFSNSEYPRSSKTSQTVTRYITYTGNSWQLSTTKTNTCYAVTTKGNPATGGDLTISASPATIESINGTSSLNAQFTSYTPAYITYRFNNADHNWYDGSDHGTTTPSQLSDLNSRNYEWSMTNADGKATLSEYGVYSAGLTYSAPVDADRDVIVKLNISNAEFGINREATTNVTLKMVQVPVERIIPSTYHFKLEQGDKATLTCTYEPANANTGTTFTFSSSNESIVTVDSRTGAINAVGYGYATLTISNGQGVTKEVGVYVARKCAKPVISFASIGEGETATATITTTTDDATIYYTVNGETPTASSTRYTAPFVVNNHDVVRAIAMSPETGSKDSEVATATYIFVKESGISGTTVILNDYEDHTWTYYAGVDPGVDGGKYNDDYLDIMYSPDPRNVKITYNGGGVSGASAVAISGEAGEDQNTMIYYKTIEKHQVGEGTDYAYHVIPNPFCKRPRTYGATGTNGYYGFGGWKLISGGEYIQEYNNNDVLPLEPTIHFTGLPYPSVNCTSAEIVFEATWVPATVYVQGTKPNFTSGTYETNFWVLSSNPGADVTLDQNMTFTQVTPDGGATADYRGTTMTRGILFSHGDGVTPKIEFMKRNSGTRFNPNGKNMFIGRGVTNSVTSSLYGSYDTSANTNQVVRVESGNYGTATHYNATPNSVTKSIFIWGCDYDRAKGVNTNLTINEAMVDDNSDITSDESKYIAQIYVKSGRFAPNSTDSDGGSSLYYVGRKSATNNLKPKQGLRYMEIQGGELRNIAGASTDHQGQRETIAFRMRMKGGVIHGMAFGCARGNPSYGSRAFILTGGKCEGWLTPGSNGNNATLTGYLYGRTYLYAGGNFSVNSNGSTSKLNRSVGGNLFGSGCGYDSEKTIGGCELGSNTVVADNAYVERGVYAGGSFGYSDGISYIYITGGHVGGANGGISADGETYNPDIQGGVYGGSCQNKGNSANIIMTGGRVDTGIYGGSNRKGVMSGYTNILITGGTVNGNVHGGGYGENTVVNQNVDISIGLRNASTGAVSGDAVINGDVYGGSALGKVNGTTAADTYHTNVTLNSGIINGSLYGGALGSNDVAANVYGPVAVKVYGGTVNTTSASGSGAVYGANNINGAPQRAVTVDIYGTDPAPSADAFALDAVYGGGNQAAYTYGNGYPTVTVHGCDNSIEYVYGGGNAAAVAATDVTIWGGNKIGNVFGGGNGQVRAANVNGNTNVKIYGGTIGDVYGGSNTNGTIGETINVLVNKTSENGDDGCDMVIDNVYGGGNKAASNVGNVTIQCTGTKDGEGIGAVYGGANQADVTGNITLNIRSGTIANVFGGNNNSGSISGSITVNVNEDSSAGCGKHMEIGNVYGGGNKAEYTGSPTVNIINATMTGSVFGGGLGKSAVVVGNPIVNIGSWTEGLVIIGGDVFGGGDLAAVEGECNVTIRDCNTQIFGDLYGGGNAAPVYSTNTTMWGGLVKGNVFGGGNGQDADKNPNGAQVGYKRDDSTAGGTGVAVTRIFGGTVGTWTGDGATVCVDGTGGVFGGSNTNGNIRGGIGLTLNQQTCTEPGATDCGLKLREIYGAGNEAAYAGTGIAFDLGCVDYLEEIYGGAKAADLNADAKLTISSGHFKKVFGGNNVSGKLNGSITVTVEETGCNPVIIDELYGGGNLAAYSVYGYEDALVDGKVVVKTTGIKLHEDPQVNIISCTHIGKVFGGGLGGSAVMVGNPTVNIQEVMGGYPRKHYDAESKSVVDADSDQLGSIGTVFGGGNEAKVIGSTTVNVATESGKSAYILDNIYGGGNQADVTGKTNVTVGE